MLPHKADNVVDAAICKFIVGSTNLYYILPVVCPEILDVPLPN
jgi:hypothetical protein